MFHTPDPQHALSNGLIANERSSRERAREPFDPASLMRGVVERWPVVAIAMVVAMLAGVAFIVMVPPLYTAQTQILVDPADLQILEKGVSARNGVSDGHLLQVESQARVIESDNVLRRVIAAEGLDRDPDFGGRTPSKLRDFVRALLEPLGEQFSPPEIDPTVVALNTLRREMWVKRAERTYVIDVAVRTTSREKSVRIANAIAHAYMEEQRLAQADAARRASESLALRLNELKENVRHAEERVESFKARNSIVRTGTQLVTEQQLSEVTNQLGVARARTLDAAARVAQMEALLRSSVDPGSFTEAVQSPTMSALRAQYAEVTRREGELASTLGPRHPALAEVKAQAERLRGVINQELRRIADAARNEHKGAQANEAALAARLDALKTDSLSTNEAMVTLRELERDVQASRAVYESFLVRTRETREQEQLNTKNIRVISEADTPLRRSWPPSNLVVIGGAAALGGLLGLALALWRTVRATRRRSSAPVVAAVPIDPVSPT